MRLFKFAGHEVIRQNHLGGWPRHTHRTPGGRRPIPPGLLYRRPRQGPDAALESSGFELA
ncbi:hypothetical protein [Nocardiopsis sp. CNT-189]|uniref:hypothetical protein n=1 Tax=Nocardiopsis oceanisediminis TaxID=2816862 RepID=UPI003B3A3AD6